MSSFKITFDDAKTFGALFKSFNGCINVINLYITNDGIIIREMAENNKMFIACKLRKDRALHYEVNRGDTNKDIVLSVKNDYLADLNKRTRTEQVTIEYKEDGSIESKVFYERGISKLTDEITPYEGWEKEIPEFDSIPVYEQRLNLELKRLGLIKNGK